MIEVHEKLGRDETRVCVSESVQKSVQVEEVLVSIDVLLALVLISDFLQLSLDIEARREYSSLVSFDIVCERVAEHCLF